MRQVHRQLRPRLRRERILRGWSLKDAADRLCQVAAELGAGPLGVDGNAVGRWERGESNPYPRYVQLLCRLYGRTADALDLVDALSEPGPAAPSILGDVKRRRFIQYVSAVGSATLIDPDKVAAALGGITRPDERLLDDLEAVTKSLVDDYWTASPASVVPAVEGHLEGLRNLLATQAIGDLGRRLRRIASDTAALAGWLAFRLESRSDAYTLWAFAAALAEEAGDGPLRAHTLISRSNLYSATWRDGQGGDADTAIALLEAAATAAGSLSSPLLRAWLYARRAEEYAVRGDALACYQDLERAARALSQAPTPDNGFLRSWNLGQLAGYQGNCAQLLGRPQEAATILDKALPQIPTSLLSQRCAALTNLAAAHAQLGEEGVEQACMRLGEALAIAGPAGLAVAQQRIVGVRNRRLASLAKLPPVQQLDEQLRIWTAPS